MSRETSWNRWNWVIASSAILAVTLGIFGFHRATILVLTPNPTKVEAVRLGWEEACFRAFGLLTGGTAGANQNWLLRLARACGTLFGSVALFRLLGPWLAKAWMERRARRATDHDVVIGLGTKGRAVLEHRRAQTRADRALGFSGRRLVVGLDKEPLEPSETEDRSLGIHVLGDALQEDALARVNVKAARRVFIATRSDGVNIEIAGRVVAMLAAEPAYRYLELFVHVADPVLRREAFPGMPGDGIPPVLPRPFALSATAARRFLARFPVVIRARENGTAAANVVFVGFDTYAEEVLLHTLRLGPLAGQAPPRFTVFTSDVAGVRARLARDYPAAAADPALDLAKTVRVLALASEGDLSEDQLQEAEDLPVTAVLVQAASDAACFALALRTRRTARLSGRWKAPFFMRVDDGSQFHSYLTHLRSSATGEPAGDWKTSPFLEQVLEPYGEYRPTIAAIVDESEWNEKVARHLHDDYQRRHGSEKRSAAQRTWGRVSEEFRDSNRRAADHGVVKLASAGFVVEGDIPVLPSSILDALTKGTVPSAVVDRLARLEHDSWCREKRLSGWRPGGRRDDFRKLHEALIPFQKLRPDQRTLDVESIIALAGPLTARDGDRRELSTPARQRQIAARIEQKPGPHGDGVGRPTVFKERIIGLAGHNVVELASARTSIHAQVGNILDHLDARNRLGPDGHELWTFVTPLAPGADYMLAKAVVAHLRQRQLARFRLRVVQSVPLAALVAAWRAQHGFERGTPDGEVAGSTLVVRRADGTTAPNEGAVEA
ncbi:MAG TPA: RyR domain-containing protein, partial [Polyangia bacterium]